METIILISTVRARINRLLEAADPRRVSVSLTEKVGGWRVKNRLNLSWSPSLMEPLAAPQNSRSLSEVVEVGRRSVPDVHSGMSAGCEAS